MPAATGHPVFPPPDNPDVRIWRYMDFAKYAAMLESGGLFFSRADLLGDPFEGARSRANYTRRQEVYGAEAPGVMLSGDYMASLFQGQRQWTLVNCWHMGDHESAAMWRLYARSNQAVAVQSTFNRLHFVLPEDAFVGPVCYIDYEQDWVPEGNALAPFVCKRKSFEHEHELRAVISVLPPQRDGAILIDAPNPERGRSVPVDLKHLVEAVYVAPTAPTWVAELVRNVTARCGFAFVVHQSALDAAPLF
jgi:hypothetical protein